VYLAPARRGETTTTDDAEGEVVATVAVDVSRQDIEAALARFVGRTWQRPPAYSAIKQGGVRAYARARRGEEVELLPRLVEIHELAVVELALPDVTLRVSCGPGTYVRALARDLGQSLGTGGHLVALRRLASGRFGVANAHTVSEIERRAWGGEPIPVMSSYEALGHLPVVALGGDEIERLLQGQAHCVEHDSPHPAGGGYVSHHSGGQRRSVGRGALAARGRPNALQPVRVRPGRK
jgi:tRNA pseudouridine55 synthase